MLFHNVTLIPAKENYNSYYSTVTVYTSNIIIVNVKCIKLSKVFSFFI